MRALLIVNSHATATTPERREVIARALSSALDLEVVQTRYRGHAASVARSAAREGFGLVLTLGGDGTVNETVNGLLASPTPDSPRLAGPALAPLPGGNANVFSRALGLPPDPVDATAWILAALASGKSRTIGLGQAGDRYFCFNAGLGIDAEVVRVVEGLRARRSSASTAMYLWAAARQFWLVTDRKDPALTVVRDGEPLLEGLFCGFVSNTSPWTYLGSRPVKVSPDAAFSTGLDLFALRKLGTFGTLNALRQMLATHGRAPHGHHVASVHDLASFAFQAARPIALQVDGEYVGERECVTFRAIPNALRVIG